MVLWGALAALVVGAIGLVVANGGDGGGGSPALPLSVGSGQGAGDAQVASAAPLELAAPTTYVASDDLPAGGGSAPAYRLAGSVDEAAVRDMAAALGIEGDPTERDGNWHVGEGEGEMVLDVYGPGASWTAYRSVEAAAPPAPPGAEGGTTGSAVRPDAPASDAPVSDAPASDSGECVERDGVTTCTMESSASASPGVAAACPADPAALCPDPRTPERPADLPSEDEARDIALELVAATGTNVEGADVRVADGVVQWAVAVEPRLGGHPAPGLTASVAVGAGGRIESASGYVGRPEELGDYDLIDTRAALDRLNDGSWGYPTPGAGVIQTRIYESGTSGASPETTIPPDAGSGSGSASGGGSSGQAGAGGADSSGDQPRTLPAPAEEAPGSTPTDPPTTGTLPPTTAVDGGGQIAPGEPAPGGPPAPAPEPEPVEVAVTDAEVVLVGVPSWDGTGTYLVPGYRFTADDGYDPIVPAVADDVLAPPPDGRDEEPNGPTDPVPLPAPVEPESAPATPETTVAGAQPEPATREIDITLWHCGIEPLEAEGRRWVADPPPFDETTAPPELTRHGTLTVAPDGGSATYTDDSGITVDLVPVADDWQPPPCD